MSNTEPTLYDVLRCLNGAPCSRNEARSGPFRDTYEAAAWLSKYLKQEDTTPEAGKIVMSNGSTIHGIPDSGQPIHGITPPPGAFTLPRERFGKDFTPIINAPDTPWDDQTFYTLEQAPEETYGPHNYLVVFVLEDRGDTLLVRTDDELSRKVGALAQARVNRFMEQKD